MEHRLSRRIDCDIELLIMKKGIPAAVGRIKNISRHGMFIATDYQQAGIWQPVELELLAALPTCKGPRRFRMIVTRKTGKGLGVELERIESEQAETLALLATNAFADTHPATLHHGV